MLLITSLSRVVLWVTLTIQAQTLLLNLTRPPHYPTTLQYRFSSLIHHTKTYSLTHLIPMPFYKRRNSKQITPEINRTESNYCQLKKKKYINKLTEHITRIYSWKNPTLEKYNKERTQNKWHCIFNKRCFVCDNFFS